MKWMENTMQCSYAKDQSTQHSVEQSTWGSIVENEAPRCCSSSRSVISYCFMSNSHFFLLANASSTISRFASGWIPTMMKCSKSEVGSLNFSWSYMASTFEWLGRNIRPIIQWVDKHPLKEDRNYYTAMEKIITKYIRTQSVQKPQSECVPHHVPFTTMSQS